MKPFDLEAAKTGNPICLNGAWLYALFVIGLALAFWADALSPPLQAERLTAATAADVTAEQVALERADCITPTNQCPHLRGQ